MPRNPEFDAYIAKAAPFARPILERIRSAYHKADPAIEETIKWGAPHFERNGIIGSMAAFKSHVRWGFWKASLMKDPHGILADSIMGETTMSGSKASDVSELPSEKVLVEYIREAVKLNESGAKVARKKPAPVPAAATEPPAEMLEALRAEPRALENFEKFAPSHKREYVQWITEAKQEQTRLRRIAQAVQWIAEGKSRNWKYERK